MINDHKYKADIRSLKCGSYRLTEPPVFANGIYTWPGLRITTDSIMGKTVQVQKMVAGTLIPFGGILLTDEQLVTRRKNSGKIIFNLIPLLIIL
jgi:hypothetical protein